MTTSTPPPSGTVTFLFTDIEGSTRLWDEHPGAMEQALLRHDGILRAAIESEGGFVFKTIGDAFCAAFARADAALRAAARAQAALQAEDWSAFDSSFPELWARMGIHTGEASEREGDYFGPPVNRVARIEAAGNGGQVLISLATQQLVRERLPEGHRLRELGTHRLKDLSQPETLFQLVVSDVADRQTPLRTAGTLHPRDRIIVDESQHEEAARPIPLDRALQETLEVLRDEESSRTVTLTRDQLTALVKHRSANLTEYRLGRVAEWSQSQYRLDGRFVGLTMLLDRGEEVTGGRWQAQEERFEDLRAILGSVDESAMVLLGPPGAGKSTLLRRFELDTAIDMLRDETESSDKGLVTLFLSA